MKVVYKSAFILLSILLSYALVYWTGGTSQVYVHVFYVPIILAARYFRTGGALIFGLLSGIASGPFMPLYVAERIPQSFSNWSIRVLVFVIFALFMSFLFKKLKDEMTTILQQNEKLNQQNQDIEQKNKQIEEQKNIILAQKEEIQQLGTEILLCLAEAIEVRDPFTSGHCRRVGELAYEVGRRLNLGEQELLNLQWSGIIHDVGKIGIPEQVLSKQGELSSFEHEIVKQHPMIGAQILKATRYAEKVIDGVLHHHERLDGSGFPEGLTGDKLGLQAKIIAICDVWDALTAKHRGDMDQETARTTLEQGRGKLFDSEILDVFFDVVRVPVASKAWS
ncbi:HD-GYP domain-containing protein [Gordoniibacillus kamchatkensis]|uniref:HD-GYP domain-containing protein n=1 Tax=Gordoniibacillus kamchatkensis TaxID=1590651 RepID=UPI000698109C|nr:HD domain-containing phosphohydrolase [Paenibacillus sp. VKM B-2647]